MAGIKISAMDADASIGGTELIPVSDTGAPKSVTTADIKSYVVDQIEAIAAASSVTGADSVFILQSGVLKPVDIDVVAQHAIDTIWGKDAEASPDSADVMVLKDGGTTEKTVTLSVLTTYIQTAIEASVLDVSGLTTASALAGADYFLVSQSSVAKKISETTLLATIFAALDTYVTALSATTSPAGTDVLYCIKSGVEKKVVLSDILDLAGDVFGPATTTEDKIPQWSSAQLTLKDGKTVQTTIRGTGVAVDTAIPTEGAVRDMVDTLIYDLDDVGAALTSVDTIMVDDGGLGTTPRKSTLLRLWTYITSLTTVQTTGVVSIASGANTVAVTGLGLATAIIGVIAHINKPDANGDLITAHPRLDSFSAAGFTVDLSAPTPDATYDMTYMLVLA